MFSLALGISTMAMSSLAVSRLRRSVLAIAALAAVACESSTGNDGSIASVSVNPGTHVLPIGQTKQLIATPTTSSGLIVDGRTATWVSASPTVATVSSTGLVTGIAGGTAVITATVGGQSATATVTVLFPTQTVTLAPAAGPATTIRQEGSVQLTPTFVDASGATVTGRQVIWTSSNPAVARVSGSGLVSGLTDGTTTITATTLDGAAGTRVITVSGAPVVFAASLAATWNRYIGIGQTEQLVAGATAQSGTVLSLAGRTVVYSSATPAVATVDANGLVTMLANTGSSVITVTVDGVAATLTVVGATTLTAGTPILTASLAANASTYYAVEIGAGKTNLTLATSGGAGDVDIYAYRPGQTVPTSPSSATATCAAEGANTNESCSMTNPIAGRWILRVLSFAASTGFNTTATVTPP